MKIVESFDKMGNMLTSMGEYFLKIENLKVQIFNSFGDTYDIVFSDLGNALKVGKNVDSIKINNISYNNWFTLRNYIKEEFKSLRKYFEDVLNYNWVINNYGWFDAIELENYKLSRSVEKGIRVFTPFYKPNRLTKEPKKWNLTHFIKAALNGQCEDFKCEGKYTDDYAFDAAYNFFEGSKRGMEFVKDIIESPSGWRVRKDDQDGRVHVNCHHFNYNSFIFDVDGNDDKLEENKKEEVKKVENEIVLSFDHSAVKTKQDLINLKNKLKNDEKFEELLNNSKSFNEVLKVLYNLEGKELKTFDKWRKEGKKVKKGSKAYTFWSQPIKVKEQDEKGKEVLKYRYFKICKLFSVDQVEVVRKKIAV